MKKKLFVVAILFLAFIFSASAKQIQINVLNYEFSPKSFTASQGDTIHFVWVAGFHTTTSTSVPSGALTWDQDIDNTSTSFLYPLKVAGNYAFQCNFHVLMGMTGTFTVLPLTKVTVVKSVSVNNCTNTNSIQYKCTRSKPTYKVQLFRYGQSFGSPRIISDTLPFTISSLPIGSYFAKAKGNGGTDSLSGKSGTTVLMPVPSGLKALHITGSKATLKWTPYTCVKFYTVQYRKKGVTTWTKINTLGNKDSINLTSLTLNTKYQFQVASVDSAHKIIATGKFSAIDSFLTTSSATNTLNDNYLLDNSITEIPGDNNEPVNVFPNPVSTQFRIQTKNNSFVSALLRSIDGKVVWTESNHTLLERGKELDVDVSNMPAGIYFLQLIDINNNNTIKKIVVAK